MRQSTIPRPILLALLALVAACGSSAGSKSTPSNDSGVIAFDASVPVESGADTGQSGTDTGESRSEAGVESQDSGDAADSGGNVFPPIAPGEPISAPDGVWTEVLFPDGYCRDGSQAHLEVHLNSMSQKVAIYLEGGGACFNDPSCDLLTTDLPSYVLGGGIFNFNNPANPIGDWNIFYVPYCEGDVHAGDNPKGDPGPITGIQNYEGFTNLQLYISRILATVPDATDELLVGSSAGGVGTGLTAGLFASNVGPNVQRITLLDDSGPPLSSQYIPTCLQDMWRTVWGFDNTFLKQCGAACPTQNDYVYDWISYLVNTYAKGPLGSKFMGGLISHATDAVISTFYGFGADNCTSAVPVPLNADVFEAGLLDFRQFVQAQTPLFGTFYATGSAHTFLLSDSAVTFAGVGMGGLYDTTAEGVSLVDWIDNLLAHTPATQVGP